MNYRSKTTSMVLCFFFGLLGAHWFYLGHWRWGILYATVTLGAWPAALVMAVILSAAPGLGALCFIGAWIANGIIFLCVIYDLFCLLAIHPREFDFQFNR